MRVVVLGVILAAGLAGAAGAADYVVVASTDPALKPGLEVAAGQALALAPGKSLTLMNSGGVVTILRGGPGGATAPRSRTASLAADRLEALRALVAPPPVRHPFGGSRAGVCPEASSLKTLDHIIQAQKGGCVDEARQALDGLVARAEN
jgi:hypothetical protein